MVMVKVDKVSKRFGSLEVLRNINLRVKKGEFLVIFGEVGAGKSTLIKMMYFQEFPDRGNVEVLGMDSSQAKRSKGKVQEVRRKIGVITQEPKFLNEMTCFENITFVLESLGLNKRLATRRAEIALEGVGMLEMKDKYPHELSAGQKQKIARAISREPVLLLADDPTLGLDERSSYEIEHLFLSLNEMGTTVVWSSNKIPKNIGGMVKIYHLQAGTLARV